MFKTKKTLIALNNALFILLIASTSWAQSGEGAEKTLSPYFLVKSSAEGSSEQFPLKATKSDINIAGTIADVHVTQVYKNEGTQNIEAIYVFPGSTRAAVYAMQMTIGDRLIKAKIKEKEEAKAAYETAKKEGKSASLLEEHRPNVFKMNVANILPGDEIKVELSYTETVVPTEGVYEFTYPTVVGPRYSNQKADSPKVETWVANPYLTEKKEPNYTFDLKVGINAGMALKDLATPTHKTSIQYDGAQSANIALDKSESNGGNRDFVLRYRLAGESIESGLLLYKGETENFFLATVQPPKQVQSANILPREYIFVVDVSGSMYGFPLDTSKALLRDLIKSLRETDRFNVLLFSGGSSVLAPQPIAATQENVDLAVRLIESQRGGGGTEILPALKQTFAMTRDEAYSRSVVVITDGYVMVEPEVFDMIRKNLNDTNVFAFGIGSGVNRHLIEGMAHVGGGEPFIVLNPAEAPAKAKAFKRYIESPVLRGINVTYYDFDVYDVEPVSVADVLAERPIQIFGKWRGKPQGRIVVSGKAANGDYVNELNLSDAKVSAQNSALRYLWARERIRFLSDYSELSFGDEKRREVTNLGLTYNLLTPFTSFIAIDEVVRAKNSPLPVKQPLPLPQGVSNLAVGGVAPTVPEPETYLLMAVMTLVLGWQLQRRWKVPQR